MASVWRAWDDQFDGAGPLMGTTINNALNGGVTLTSPTTVTSSGSVVYGGFSGAAVVDGSGPGTLVNFGNISASLVAVSLGAGGFVYNGVGGMISAPEALSMPDQATLINAGVISSSVGILLGQTQMTNTSSGRVTGGVYAVTGSVVNAGTIENSGGAEISFLSGGTVLNEGTASLLTGNGRYGVVIAGAAGYVSNQGTVAGVDLLDGGVAINAGYIGKINEHYGVEMEGTGIGDVQNAGFITGVGLQNGGAVTNAAGGTISGYISGVYLYGGTLVNRGTVLGVGGVLGLLNPAESQGEAGVSLALGGFIDNASSGAVIQGLKDGVWLASAGGGAAGAITVVNDGTVIGGVGIRDSGTSTDTIYNAGVILGTTGVAVSFGSGTDLLILEQGSSITGAVEGGAGRSVVEFAYGAGIRTVNNLGPAFAGVTTLLNMSTLELTGNAALTHAALFENEGVILDGGAALSTLGTVENAGTIGMDVTLGVANYILLSGTAAPYFLNEAGAVLRGDGAAALIELGGNAPATVVNAGTIEAGSDGVAISFAAGGSSVLILDPGSEIMGEVIGGGGAGSMLELAAGPGVGTISGLQTQFMNFAHVSVASAADWVIDGATVASLIVNGRAQVQDVTVSSGVISLGAGATLSFAGEVNTGQTIGFGGGSGMLSIGDASAFYGTIAGFAVGETIDLTGMGFSAGGTASVKNGVLTVVENGETAALALTGSFSKDVFHLGSDGVNGTDVTAVPAAACFLKGTGIATIEGEVAVETLRIGDMVLGPDGTAAPVKWIGRRRYQAGLRDGLPASELADITPIRVAAGALADGVPERDLYVSPMHALFLEGFLVPAGALVNGASVRACPEIEDILYYHIETEAHSLVLANGAPAETFIDHASRRMFENVEEFYRLYPKGALNGEEFLAPRLESGPDLEGLRRRVAMRAGMLLGQDAGAEIVGYLEAADRQVISGWAFARAQPHIPVRLEIVANGAVLARTVANLPRPDVRQAGFGHGRCGFSVTLPAPLPALRRHEITVRQAGGAPLAGSPVVLDPGITPELLNTGGLAALIAAAAKGSAPRDAVALGAALEAAGRQLKQAPARRRATAGRDGGLALVVDEFWPAAGRDAGSNAVLSHVAALRALGYRVAFCAAEGAPATAQAQAAVMALGAMRVECLGLDGATVEASIRALAPAGLALVYVHRLAAASAYTGLVRLHAPAAKVIYAVADLHHLRLARQAAAEARPELALKAKTVQAAEFWAMRMADAVVTHSAAEADYLSQELPMANVHVVPWAVTPGDTFRDDGSRVDIAFIGGAGHAPNADAVEWLGRSVMPEVWRVLPQVRCLVIGGGWSVDRLAAIDPRMVPVGQVPSLGEALATARLTVAPLRFGAGIKGKVLDSFAAGLPCVMTPVAAEGLALDEELRLAVADGAEFAARVLEVYSHAALRRRLRRAGQKLVRRDWSDTAVTAAMAAVVGRAVAAPEADLEAVGVDR